MHLSFEVTDTWVLRFCCLGTCGGHLLVRVDCCFPSHVRPICRTDFSLVARLGQISPSKGSLTEVLDLWVGAAEDMLEKPTKNRSVPRMLLEVK
mmetsp:Transcript_40794/g.108087  ORF Transcript_40794/g.108087 Transcript_40794/m.108087 type:complete len:94 (-) Transcript_40794:353-634(-)